MVIQHIECEPLGLFAEEAAGLADFIYIRPFQGEHVPASLEGWDGLIILGGPIAVYESDEFPYLGDEIRLVAEAIRTDFPVLGICLGSQIIAAAAGAAVYPGPRREAGWSEVVLTVEAAAEPLFAGLPSPLPVFQLHGDTFDLPSGATRLASSDLYANQAFRIGNNVYGLQFHVEASSNLILEWADYYSDYIAGAGVSPENLLKDMTPGIDPLRHVASQVITGFLKSG